MRVGIAADHGGFYLKQQLKQALENEGWQVSDFGAAALDEDDDYPDYVIPLARAVASGTVERGIAVCGSGVGACVAANKLRGVRGSLVCDIFSAHQGVEDDDMNLICMGGRVIGFSLAWELTRAFLGASFSGEARHRRRLDKVRELEAGG